MGVQMIAILGQDEEESALGLEELAELHQALAAHGNRLAAQDVGVLDVVEFLDGVGEAALPIEHLAAQEMGVIGIPGLLKRQGHAKSGIGVTALQRLLTLAETNLGARR